MADDTGSKHDVIQLSRHLLNHAATNQTISKQECMVLVGGLDLVKCSETIEAGCEHLWTILHSIRRDQYSIQAI
jgi:hypothetical protein